jgi:hypothetical protein
MEPEGSLPCSQEPLTDTYPPDQSSSYHCMLLLQNSILIVSIHLHLVSLVVWVHSQKNGTLWKIRLPDMEVADRGQMVVLLLGPWCSTNNKQNKLRGL